MSKQETSNNTPVIEGLIIKEEKQLTIEETVDIYRRSFLTRPIDDETRLNTMLSNTNLTVVARIKGEIVGVVQALSDLSYSCFISAVCVDQNYRKLKIGNRMMAVLFERIGPGVTTVVVARQESLGFYKKTGFEVGINTMIKVRGF